MTWHLVLVKHKIRSLCSLSSAQGPAAVAHRSLPAKWQGELDAVMLKPHAQVSCIVFQYGSVYSNQWAHNLIWALVGGLDCQLPSWCPLAKKSLSTTESSIRVQQSALLPGKGASCISLARLPRLGALARARLSSPHLTHDIIQALVASIEVGGGFLMLLPLPLTRTVCMQVSAVPAAPPGFVTMLPVIPIRQVKPATMTCKKSPRSIHQPMGGCLLSLVLQTMAS